MDVSEDATLEDKFDVLSFDGSILNHIEALRNAPEGVFRDFCRLALDYLNNGLNNKKCNTAAEKLKIPLQKVINMIYGITYILISACKYDLNENDFNATLTDLNLSEENKSTLIKFLSAKKDNIRRALRKFNVNITVFNNVDWRLEAQVASRSMSEQVIPSVVLDFSFTDCNTNAMKNKNIDSDTKKGAESDKIIKHKVIQCDIPNLDNMISGLETALRETKYYHAKKTKAAITKE